MARRYLFTFIYQDISYFNAYPKHFKLYIEYFDQ